MKKIILFILIGLNFGITPTDLNSQKNILPIIQKSNNHILKEKKSSEYIQLEVLECVSNDDCQENELCFGNTCEALGIIQESWVLTTYGQFENSDCSGVVDNDEDFVNGYQLQYDFYDNNLVVASSCWFNYLIGFGYWSINSTGYIITQLNGNDTLDTSYILDGNYLYTNTIIYENCLNMTLELGISNCVEETCDPNYVGTWDWTGNGTYENGDCSGELELNDFDGQVILFEDCTMEFYDTWCENPQDNPEMCTGEWSSEGNIITMGPLFYRDWVVENNIMSNNAIVTYMPDLYDESTWYDICTYNKYTFDQLETINKHNSLPNFPILYDAYPNPFNPVTNISYGLPSESDITLNVYDVEGRRITLLTEGIRTAGAHSIEWNASSYPSGIYFVKLNAGEFTQTQKLMLVK